MVGNTMGNKKPQIILDDEAHEIVADALSDYIKRTKDTTKKYTHIVNELVKRGVKVK